MPEVPSTLVEAVEQIRLGVVTPMALLEACLNRIERLDDRLHAWVRVDAERARQQAERLGAELRSGKPPRSPLHGVPIGVKDVIDVISLPTEAGSPLRRGKTALADAPVVAHLRRAGAVIVGKTVTTEYACFDPSPTRNPWNLAHTPGGSSSGSAAAIAAGMCYGALGTQTGGSIIRPAAYCGVCGLKPTFGRLSIQGIVPVTFHLDHVGPLARTVADLAILWSVLSEDETAIEHVENAPPRLGLLRGFFEERADAAMREALEDALARLKAAGATVVECPLPENFLEVHSMHRRIMAVEAAEYHRCEYAAHSEQYGPNISALIEEGLSVTAVDYAAALKFQSMFRHEAFEMIANVDALVTPGAPTPAPADLGTTGDPSFNSPWSLAGLPTVTLPCSLAANGLPCGLQLIGRWRGERELLKTALWCERRLEFSACPPALE